MKITFFISVTEREEILDKEVKKPPELPHSMARGNCDLLFSYSIKIKVFLISYFYNLKEIFQIAQQENRRKYKELDIKILKKHLD